jgi:hypothetical protein
MAASGQSMRMGTCRHHHRRQHQRRRTKLRHLPLPHLRFQRLLPLEKAEMMKTKRRRTSSMTATTVEACGQTPMQKRSLWRYQMMMEMKTQHRHLYLVLL